MESHEAKIYVDGLYRELYDHWDRKIIVPKGHELTELDGKATLQDLARYPLVTYVFSFGGHSSLKKAFADQGLEPDVVFTARDADVIKTYVRMGLGVGIVRRRRIATTGVAALGLLFRERARSWHGYPSPDDPELPANLGR